MVCGAEPLSRLLEVMAGGIKHSNNFAMFGNMNAEYIHSLTPFLLSCRNGSRQTCGNQDMDLSVIYSKTGKGVRSVKSRDLPSHLIRVLALIDGKSKAEALLAQSGGITGQEMAQALTQLENGGYIRPLLTRAVEDTWHQHDTFASMVVEEIHQVEEAGDDTLDFSNYTAEAEAKTRAEAERKAREETEARAKAQAETERKALEEAKAKAEQKVREEGEAR